MGFINNSFTKSPEAASLERFGEIPVDEFTGTTSVSLPLYDVRSRNLSVPISLNYHASGIKVNQEATWVGLGWDLSVGGRISLNVIGGVDGVSEYGWDTEDAEAMLNSVENSVGTDEYCYIRFATACIGISGTGEMAACVNDTWRDSRYLVIDMDKVGALQPDMYTVSVNDINFTFYKHPVTGQFVYKGEKKKYRIEAIPEGWKITDDRGIEYFFEQGERHHFAPSLTPNIPNKIISWMLTKIKHPLGDEILLTYQNFGKISPAHSWAISETYYNGNISGSNLLQQNQIENQYLSRIETTNVQVDFTVAAREDLAGVGARKLSKISVTDKLNSKFVKKILFEQDYFQSPNSKRLRLSRVIENSGSDYVDPESKIHAFEYEQLALPDKTSTSQDHWGYYNGESNGTNPIPSISSLISEGILQNNQVCNVLSTHGGVTSPECQTFPLIHHTSDRSPSTSHMKAGMLKKITYPTGGYTLFTYEPHVSYYHFNDAYLGGGLRIKLIESFDESARNVNFIEYQYLNTLGKSSGNYMGRIQYHKVTNVTDVMEVDMNGLSHIGTNGYWVYYSDGNINESGYAVAYDRVTKLEWNEDKSKANGKTVKSFYLLSSQDCFSTNMNVPLHTVPAVPAYGNGKLVNEKIYDQSGTLIREKKINYTFLDFESIITHVKIDNGSHIPPQTSIYPLFTPHPNWGRYTLYFTPTKSYVTVMDSSTELSYLEGTAVKTTSFYHYNTDYQLREKGMITSDNKVFRTLFQYPKNRVTQGTTNPYSQMVGKNILSPIVEEESVLGTESLSKTITNYKEWYATVILPEVIQYKYKTDAPENAIRYVKYNSAGNLLCARQENGMPITYLWGYNGAYPIAEIKNATYDEVSAVLTESSIAQWYSGMWPDAQLRSTLHPQLRMGLPNAQITIFTYAPLIGMTSKTDMNYQTTYYEYDALNRLKLVKDHDGNILKRFTYHYKD